MDTGRVGPLPARIAFGLLVVAGLAVGALALAPLALGGMAQERFEAVLAAADREIANAEWHTESFERGAYVSTATSRLTYRPPDPGSDPVRIRLRHRIHHGPRLDGLYLVRVESVPVIEGAAAERLREVFGEREPITVTWVERLGGGARARVHSPALAGTKTTADGARVSWDGLDVRATLSRDGDRLRIDGGAPSGRIATDDGTATLAGFELAADLVPGTDIVHGDASVRLAALTFAPVPGSTAGNASALRGVELRQSTAIDDGALATRVDLAIAELEADGERVSDLHATLRVRGIPVDLVAAINDAGRRARRAGTDPDAAVGAVMRAYPPHRLVASEPALELTRLEATTPAGAVAFSGSVRMARPDGGEPRSWLALLMLLEVDARADVPAAVAADIVAGIVRRRLEEERRGDEIPAAQLEAMAREQLRQWQQRGWVAEHDGRLASELAYARGVMRVNGIEVMNLGRMFGP